MWDYNFIKYRYKVYGLKILSQILISELPLNNEEVEQEYDAVISYGVVPKQIHCGIINNDNVKMTKNEFYFYIKGVAHYYVADGNKIIVETELGSDEHEVKVYLLGTSLGILLTQRNVIAIHGGTIAINGKGIIITGRTGAGKSTLISAFREEGYKFLADDVSALGKDDNDKIIVHPSYPQAKLCRDAVEKMGYHPESFQRTDPFRDKYIIPLNKGFWDYAVILKAIYEINIGEGSGVEVNEVFGSEKVKSILRNIYRVEISRYLGFDPLYFKKCIDIANSVSVYRITRPKMGFTVNEQVNLIVGQVKEIETPLLVKK